MARLNVNPTRMELKKLKARLSTAVRGHKLLKDKSDEMIRQFTVILREAKRLREAVELELSAVLKQFSIARSVTPSFEAETAFALPSVAVYANCETQSVMGVDVPKVTLSGEKRADGLPYAYSEITGEADYSVQKASELLPKMVELAQTEKTVRMLAEEIERNKRRVNALEYVMIPQLEETIKYIKDKLDENERAAVVRLMKVKSKA
ncbi:MAG: V-type ATP synthase subunit D [Clostridia bacterium]|jgi:V/A-type H+-transporting ATPase subunit D|nr:V-type ATP synthase subunit D [Clostridiales bacterium]MBQ3506841.1 V-type ATP synthase subunit D [Clostridia bacterium]